MFQAGVTKSQQVRGTRGDMPREHGGEGGGGGISGRAAREKSGAAYIHGSVEESPSGERTRSLDLPGANTPRPWPRTETHQGSLCVNLESAACAQCVRRGGREGAWPRGRHAPELHAVAEPLKAEL